MYEIKKLEVWVATRFATLFAFIFSLVFSAGVFMLYVLAEYGSLQRNYGYRTFHVEDAIPFAFIPLLATLAAFAFTAAFCALYNVIAEHTQGIQVDLEFVPEDESKEKPV